MNPILVKLTIVVTAISLGSLAGCGTNWQQTVEDKISKQAAFDLQCDGGKVQLQQIDQNSMMMGHQYTYGARGCDKQATYKAVCASGGGCSVMNEAQMPK